MAVHSSEGVARNQLNARTRKFASRELAFPLPASYQGFRLQATNPSTTTLFSRRKTSRYSIQLKVIDCTEFQLILYLSSAQGLEQDGASYFQVAGQLRGPPTYVVTAIEIA